MKVADILNYTETFAPISTAADFDNCGVLVGDKNQQVTRAIVALDITPDTVREAHKKSAELIISHHPVIFNPLKRLTTETSPYLLAKYGITALCMHTNLDLSPIFGVNTELAKALGLINGHFVEGTYAYIGELRTAVTAQQFAQQAKKALDCIGLKYTDKQSVKKVCVSSGAGAEEILTAIENDCDLFLTGEMKHHLYIEAMNAGISVVEVGHFKSEDIVIQPLVNLLQEKFPSVKFEKTETVIDNVKYL
ncbi:MAG: Nif3-like dinuclear metal center hexameric protein [Ruminococcus sp.]|nr:Nif3-like dinuclear metal center hexameric protein [Ruminococcus sp.]